MASIFNLPELVCQICAVLSVTDLQSFRLASTVASDIAPRYMISEVYITPRTIILNRAKQIVSSPKGFVFGVKTVRFGYLGFPKKKLTLNEYCERLWVQERETHDGDWPPPMPMFDSWIKKNIASYNEYVDLWRDQRDVMQNETDLRIISEVLRCSPNLEAVEFRPEPCINPLRGVPQRRLGFNYWDKNKISLSSFEPADCDFQARHVFKLILQGLSGCQLHIKRFRTRPSGMELPTGFLGPGLWSMKGVWGFLPHVETLDLYIPSHTDPLLIHQALSRLPLRNLSIDAPNDVLNLRETVWANLTQLDLCGFAMTQEDFQVFLMKHQGVYHIRLRAIQIIGSLPDLLLFIQKVMRLSFLGLSDLRDQSGRYRWCSNPSRVCLHLKSAEEYFLRSSKECVKYNLKNPFTTGDIGHLWS